MKRLLTGPLLDAGETGPWVTAAELAAATHNSGRCFRLGAPPGRVPHLADDGPAGTGTLRGDHL